MSARDSQLSSGQELLVGVDVGSTTTKIVAVDPENSAVLYSDYRRHHAKQMHSVVQAVEGLAQRFPDIPVRIALTGSGAKPTAEKINAPFIQEVAANAVAIQELYTSVGCAVELGGQDAKMIFFRRDEENGALQVADMRMNGSCAGGTGAFIDEIALVLKVPVEAFNALAQEGRCVYDISGRCGVYAKTDIQPLLNQGVAKSDLALSAFHAIAKQTIGGLAQGVEIHGPVVFEGGPLTFNPTLIRVFAERLELSEKDIITPERPELMVAYGAAISLRTMFETSARTALQYVSALKHAAAEDPEPTCGEARPFFACREEELAFRRRHATQPLKRHTPQRGETVRAYLGIDSGSTTIKFVLLGEDEEILDFFTLPMRGSLCWWQSVP